MAKQAAGRPVSFPNPLHAKAAAEGADGPSQLWSLLGGICAALGLGEGDVQEPGLFRLHWGFRRDKSAAIFCAENKKHAVGKLSMR